MDFLKSKQHMFTKWLWEGSNDESYVVRFIRSSLQIISAVTYDLKQGQLSLRAMSLVYTTLISLVPLFAISFSVLKGLGVHNQIRPFLLNMLDALGEKKYEIANKILGFVDNIQVGVLGALGMAILIYTVLGMLQKIESSFNYVWNVSKLRSLSKRMNDYISILFIAPLFLFVSTALTASARSGYIVDKFSHIYGVDLLVTLIGFVIPYIILALTFTFLYKFVPNIKVNFKAAFAGGIVTALIWKIMGWGFSNFIADSANHAAVYSAFATIIVLMVWIYLVWLVILIGSSIGFYVQFPEYRRVRHNSIELSTELKESMAIQLMIEVARRFNERGELASTDILSKITGQPQNLVEKVCAELKEAKIIISEEDSHAWIPACPLSHISIYDIIKATRSSGADKLHCTKYIEDAKKYLNEIDSMLKEKLGKTTLQDII